MKTKFTLATALLATSVASYADINGDITEYSGKILFHSDVQPTLELTAPKCLDLLNDGQSEAVFKGLDKNLKQTSALSLSINNKICTVESFTPFNPPAATSSAPMQVPMVAMAMPAIGKSDVMSREFVFDESAYFTDLQSTRPSALILMKNVRQVTAHNKALCEGFVQVETIDDATARTGTAVEDQVVTKMPMKDDIDQASSDCSEILAKYNYQAVAHVAQNDTSFKAVNSYSNGPFLVVFHPKDPKVQQVVDLNGYTPEQIKQFGQQWHAIFEQTTATKQKSNWLTSLTSLLKSVLNIAVCGDPNLVYIFNPSLGDLSKGVCQAVSELDSLTAAKN